MRFLHLCCACKGVQQCLPELHGQEEQQRKRGRKKKERKIERMIGIGEKIEKKKRKEFLWWER